MSWAGVSMREMPWGLVRTVAPAQEPVDLDTIKNHLRLDGGGEDLLLDAYLQAARQHVETVTRYQLVTATYRLDLPAFPAILRLPKPPLQSVTTVGYTDSAGVVQILAGAAYRVATSVIPAYLEPVDAWPTITEGPGAVQVTYVAGFGTPQQVPSPYKAMLLLLIADMYEHREAAIEARITENMTYKRLLYAARLLEV